MSNLHDIPVATRTGCGERPVLRERGQREVFCGLTGIAGLLRRRP